MDFLSILNLDELSLAMTKLAMYPLFDAAHYIVSLMALREQAGALAFARRSPFACWFSSMIFCFGGAILSNLLLAEPPVAPLSNDGHVLLATLLWYLVFYCPQDLVYQSAALLPIRLVLSGMKEVTRTWKVLGGVMTAQKHYKDRILVLIAVGWAKGAGGGLMSNFEQLVRGIWRPETNELLKMSYPTKVTLLGAVMFSLQQCEYLPLRKHHLMFIYTVFLVVNKTVMMLSGSHSWLFSPLEGAVHRALFAGQSGDEASVGALKTKVPSRRSSSETCASHKEDGKACSGSLNGSAASESNGEVSSDSGTRSRDRTENCDGSSKKTD